MAPKILTNDQGHNKENFDELRASRAEMFMELVYKEGKAFTHKEAEILADSTDVDEVQIGEKDNRRTFRYERPLHVSKVRKMLEDGCHPKLVIRILGV